MINEPHSGEKRSEREVQEGGNSPAGAWGVPMFLLSLGGLKMHYILEKKGLIESDE